jgi:hypothetical protein
MLRGKGVEFGAKKAIQVFLEQHCPGEWLVEKKSLNPQPNAPDEDITISHKYHLDYPIIVEAKSAALHSFSRGMRAKIEKAKKVTHFQVKCHRSRINYTLALELAAEEALSLPSSVETVVAEDGKKIKKKSNRGDRYKLGDFDLVVASPLNAIFKDVKYTQLFDKDPLLLPIIYNYYQITNGNKMELLKAINKDWRFVEAKNIVAANNYIEPYPRVLLENDQDWKDLSNLPNTLQNILTIKLSGPPIITLPKNNITPTPKQNEPVQMSLLDLDYNSK